MAIYGGLDVGGTKIAGAFFTAEGIAGESRVVATPDSYDSFVQALVEQVAFFDSRAGEKTSVGLGIVGMIDQKTGQVDSANLPWLKGHFLRDDLAQALARPVRLDNDANCLVLAEAVDGAGAAFQTVFGLIAGTGIGGGYIHHGQILPSCNGMGGEIGHLPLPFQTPEDGPQVLCGCGQRGCVEKYIAGPALARLHGFLTGTPLEPPEIAQLARAQDAAALRTLDRYYEIFAKAMVSILHSFDPEVIVVSGGLIHLPGLFDEVPKRWGKYCYAKKPKTAFVPALHGGTAGVRGAAWLWRAISVEKQWL